MTARPKSRRSFRLAVLLLSGTALAGGTLAAYADATWTGATSADWSTATNWTPNAVPTSADNTIIDSAALNPVLSATGATNILTIGQSGTGNLDVTGAGTVLSTGAITLGLNAGASGTLTVENGATVSIGGFPAVEIGGFGTGMLTIQSAGQMIGFGDLSIGGAGVGAALVDGPGSLLSFADIIVGANAPGTLTIQNGAAVATSSMDIAKGTAGGNGTVTLTGSGSTLNATYLTVGYAGGGTLTVQNNAVATVTTSLLVGGASSPGLVPGAGTLTIASGGFVIDNGSAAIGQGVAASVGSAAFTGNVTVDGGSGLEVANTLDVGDQGGTGGITITNGALVFAQTAHLGNTADATGTVIVDGINSAFTVNTEADIGNFGMGTLTVRNNGGLGGGTIAIARQAGSNGTLTITGTGSIATVQTIVVGAAGVGQFSLLNGATASDNAGAVGYFAGGNGTAMVDDAGWVNNQTLEVGVFTGATGVLTVSHGGSVTSALTGLGFQAGASGTITITGAGSTLTSTDALTIGVSGGSGTLNILNGGTVAPMFTTTVGLGDGSSGLLAIDGAGSALNTGANIFAGGDSATPNSTGVGVITVTNGGTINDISSLELGVATGSTGSLTVDGNGSTATAVNLQVGENGTGNLTVSNGGAVSSPVVLIGSGVAGTGNVTVSGAGATLTGNTFFYVGSSGTGNLTVSNGGTAASTSGIVIGNDPTAVGRLNIGAAFTDPAAAPGVLNTPTVTFGAGDAAIVFNHTSAHYDFAPAISGLGAIVQFAGVTDLTADSNAFTGTADVHGGTLLVDGALGGAGIAVESAGTLGGKGSVTNVLVADGGTLQGVQGQTLTMTSLGLSNASNVNVTLGAAGGGGLFAVTQDINLDGMLDITAASNFNAGVYRLFDYGGALTDNGLDIGTVPGGSDASDYAVQTSVAGQVNLVNSHVAVLNFWDGTAAGSANNGAIDGGNGIWSATAPGWTDVNGVVNGSMLPQPGFAVFEGAPGVVTVDNSAGAVSVTGMQFASNGYTVTGDTITLGGGEADIRVGDGTVAGAGYTATIASALTGAGTLTKIDLGTLILTGTNTYTGGTDIDAGVLQIGNGGTMGSITGDINENGTLVFDRSDVVNFNNRIFSNGAIVVQAGTGTTILRDSETYSGQTIITAGTLQGTALSFGSSSILDNATLIISQATDASFANVISGTGSFIKQGAGSLNLTGTNTLTGGTTVATGRLAVNGSLAASVVTVQSGATLGGNGTVGGIVAQSGSNVGPGNSIGDLKVAGNYAAAAGSVYQVELDSAGHADRIDVGGTATLASGAVLNVTKTDTAAYVLGTQYTVLTAAGGVSGNYTVTGDTGGGLFTGFAASSDAHDVYLTFQKIKSFGSVGGTPNQIATGVGADGLPATSALTNALLGLQTTAAAQGAFDQLSGEIHASARTALIEGSRFVREAALERLQAPNVDHPVVWGQGFGDWGSNDGTGNAARLNHSTKGFIGGVDVAVTEDWRVGVLGGFSNTGLNVTDRNSAGGSDNYHLGLYGGTEAGAIAVRLGGAYSWHGLQTARTVSFSGFNDLETARYNGGTTQGFGEIGYKLAAGEVSLEPFANLAYVSLATDGFNEAGGSAALHVSADRENVTTTTLGLHAGEQIDLGGSTVFTARGGLGWRHAFGDVMPVSTAAFAGGSGFTIDGVPLAQDAMAVDAGFDAVLGEHLTAGLFYTGQYASSAGDNGVKARFDWRF